MPFRLNIVATKLHSCIAHNECYAELFFFTPFRFLFGNIIASQTVSLHTHIHMHWLDASHIADLETRRQLTTNQNRQKRKNGIIQQTHCESSGKISVPDDRFYEAQRNVQLATFAKYHLK